MSVAVCTAAVLAIFLMIPAPTRATDANDLCAPTADPCVVSTPITVTDGSMIMLDNRTLEIQSGGSLDVSSGTMTIQAGTLLVDAGGALLARNANDSGGTILVSAGTITVTGKIDASGDEAGFIDLEATGSVLVNSVSPNGIFADAIPLDDSGNEIDIRGSMVTIAAGAIVESLGKGEGCGGDLVVSATGDVMVAGTLDGSGGDGGSVTIASGANMNSGNITVAQTGRINATGNIAAACGGTVEFDTTGDGTNTGQLVMDGQVNVSAPVGNSDDGGGAGGEIDAFSDGSVVSNTPAAKYIAMGSGPDGDGGDVELDSRLGVIVLPAQVDVSSGGTDSGGGCLTLNAMGDVTVSGDVNGVAGSDTAGDVGITSTNGNITISADSSIDVSALPGGDAGSITLTTSAVQGPATININGQLHANGGTILGTEGGFAGLIQITAGESLSVPKGGLAEAMTRGPVSSLASGVGVVMASAARGGVSINGMFTAAGQGNGSPGGRVAVDGQTLTGSGTLDASGQGAPGGMVSVETNGSIAWSGMMLAESTGMFPSGSIEVMTDNGDFDLHGTLRTDGNSSAVDEDVSVLACQLIIEHDGVISSTETNGSNFLTGREGTVIFGTMIAGSQNVIKYNVDPPLIEGSAVITPSPIAQFDSSIQRCVVTPTPTPGMCVGDCNGDGKISVDELVRGVYIALGLLPLSDCPEFAQGGDTVTVVDLVAAVAGSLHGCK